MGKNQRNLFLAALVLVSLMVGACKGGGLQLGLVRNAAFNGEGCRQPQVPVQRDPADGGPVFGFNYFLDACCAKNQVLHH